MEWANGTTSISKCNKQQWVELLGLNGKLGNARLQGAWNKVHMNHMTKRTQMFSLICH